MIYVCCDSCPLDGMVDESKDLLTRGWVKFINPVPPPMQGWWRCPFCRRPLV